MIHPRAAYPQAIPLRQAFIALIKIEARAQKIGAPPKTRAGACPPGAIV
jgi:hypothetical protein